MREVHDILLQAMDGADISQADAVTLLNAEGEAFDAVLRSADAIRREVVGDAVTYVVNRNINFTNVCYMGCTFCAFAKRREDTGAELLPNSELVRRAREAWDRGGTEVCIQGGLHPDISGEHYFEIVSDIKAALPDMHVHAFSPFEIWYGAKKTRLSYREFLIELKARGLGSMPGTAAEILDTDVRRRLTRNKLSAEQWVEIITTAHEIGIPSTSTIMYGHVDRPEHWAAHLSILRDIQYRTGMFTELVPLGFVHEDSPLYLQNADARPGPSERESLALHAVARIFLRNTIRNIQVSWTKLGPALALRILQCGANDLGGTLMNESISRAAGAKNGQELTSVEMQRLIRAAGRPAQQRTTLYRPIAAEAARDAVPLVDRRARDPLAFLAQASPVAAR